MQVLSAFQADFFRGKRVEDFKLLMRRDFGSKGRKDVCG